MLPDNFGNQTYWKEIYPQPLAYWQASLEIISRRHFYENLYWERASLGRNIVFSNENWVLKLCPPEWVEESAREIVALGWITGKLPVQTPELVHTGAIESWSYLIQRRLPGRNLHELWKTLKSDQRKHIAFQHGEILAALHALELPDQPTQEGLRFDWKSMLAEQKATCAEDMRLRGVRPSLVDQVEGYLAASGADWQDDAHHVLLHGDLTHLNLFVEPAGAGWHITGLIDWGDARLGPPGHEFISPGVHMYLGDRTALATFYQGCGKAIAPNYNPKELMARAMLYYGGDFAFFLQSYLELSECRDWGCVEQQLW